MSFFKTYSYAALAVACVLLIILWQFLNSTENPENTYTVTEQPLQRLIAFSGTVVPHQSVELAFEVSGRINTIAVDVGDRVERGTLLAQLDTTSIDAALAGEKAALDSQKASLAALERGTRPEEKAVAQAELDRAESAARESRQSLTNALTEAYATADTAVHKTADQLFDQPKTLPRLLYYGKDAGSIPRIESSRLTIEIMLNAWYSDIRALIGNAFTSPLVALVATTFTSDSSLEVGIESARKNLLATNYFLNELIAYARSIIPGANITQAEIDAYVTALTLERTAILTELTQLNAAVEALSDAVQAESLAQARFQLSEAGNASEELDGARARVNAQDARVREFVSNRDAYIVRSPFSAVVTTRQAEVGELATAGTPVFSLDGDGELEIDARISELDVVALRVGDTAEVVFDALEQRVPTYATVAHIDPAETVLDGIAGYGVTLTFNELPQGARAGMSVDVIVSKIERERALAAQMGFIRKDNGIAYVQVLENGRISERVVTLGITIPGSFVELLNDVRPGDVLVPYVAR